MQQQLQQQLHEQLRATAEAEALTKRQAEAEAERQREAESETTPAPAYTGIAGKKIAANSSSSRAETLKRSADAGAALFARMLAGSRSSDKALEAQVRDLVLQMCCECVANVFLLLAKLRGLGGAGERTSGRASTVGGGGGGAAEPPARAGDGKNSAKVNVPVHLCCKVNSY